MITLLEEKSSEVNKSTYEFERDVLRGGINHVRSHSQTLQNDGLVDCYTCICSGLHPYTSLRTQVVGRIFQVPL